MKRAVSLMVAVTVASTARVVRAESVTLNGGITVPGKVLRHDDTGVEIQFGNGSRKFYPAGQVKSVNLDRIEALDRADKLFARGRLREAAKAYKQAVEQSPAAWARRRAGLRLVTSLRLAGDTVDAVDAYLELVAEDPGAEDLRRCVPLVWAREELGRDALTQAIVWSQPQRKRQLTDIGHLMACSVYITADRPDQARPLLLTLSAALEETTKELAKVLGWRTRLAEGGLAGHVRAWQADKELLPESARGPACFVIGEALERLGRPSEAVLAYLEAVIVYHRDPILVARAGLAAGRLLEAEGHAADAERIYHEIVQRTPHGTIGRKARDSLERLTQRPTPGTATP